MPQPGGDGEEPQPDADAQALECAAKPVAATVASLVNETFMRDCLPTRNGVM
jgi:hypothetical protein